MRDVLVRALQERFDSYGDIIGSVSEEDVNRKLDVPKNKSLAEHLWCVIGARESYAKALVEGAWVGFSCSLSTYSHREFAEKLASSAAEVLHAIGTVEDWNEEREALLLALSEHEVMHEGQVIRHLYGLEVDIPDTVKWA